jgi:PEP-CTERM motif
MKRSPLLTLFAGIVLLSVCHRATALSVIFSEDFESGTAATNFTLVADPDQASATTNEDLSDFAFAYTDLGIVGDVRSGKGARFETQNALTAFVNGLTLDGSAPVSIKYDLYADPESSGSTEYAFVGVGSGNLPFENYITAALNGMEQSDGVYAGGLTDSDTSAATGGVDYMILESDGSVAEPTVLFGADAALEAQDGTSFADILPGGTTGPSGEGTNPRTLQHQWVAVELLINGNDVSYFLNGSKVATVTSSISPVGSIGFGIMDPFPSTNQGRLVPPRKGTNIIIDNIVVTQIPEPSTVAMTIFGLLGCAAGGWRRRSRA